MYLYGIVVCSLRNSLTESSRFSNSTIGYMFYSVIFALNDCAMKITSCWTHDKELVITIPRLVCLKFYHLSNIVVVLYSTTIHLLYLRLSKLLLFVV
jgi:hypothetical protein